jgi:HK97 family phage prohead protease
MDEIVSVRSIVKSEDMIYKNLSEFRDIDEQTGIIKGYANVYNVKDSDGDISLPGSFSKTVSERAKKIKIFKNHTPQLVGVPLELDIADPYGLGLTAKMLMDTDAGRDTFHEVKFLHENGFESGMSIGGWVIKRNAKNKAEVVEYRLKEISVLTTEEPANQLSLVSAVKAVKELTEPTQEEFWNIIEKAYNVRFSDNILKSLEQFLTLKEKEPDQLYADTTQAVEPLITNIYELFI